MKNESILIKHGVQFILFKINDKYKQLNIIANNFYTLSHIANNNNSNSKKILIRDGVLQLLSTELQQLYYKYNSCNLMIEIWQYASLILSDLSGKMPNNYSNVNSMRFCYILVAIFLKSITLNDCIKSCKNVKHYDKKMKNINFIFRNICTTLYNITMEHPYMLDFLIQDLLVSTQLLNLLIKMVNYQPKSIRMLILKFFNAIFASESLRNIHICIENEYINEIINYYKNSIHQISVMEKAIINLSLSNLILTSKTYRVEILSNDNLLEVIVEGLTSNHITLLKASLCCIDSALELREQDTLELLLKYKDRKLIASISMTLKNMQIWNEVNSNITNVIQNIVSCIILGMIDIDWIRKKFTDKKRKDILEYLKLMTDDSLDVKLCLQRLIYEIYDLI